MRTFGPSIRGGHPNLWLTWVLNSYADYSTTVNENWAPTLSHWKSYLCVYCRHLSCADGSSQSPLIEHSSSI